MGEELDGAIGRVLQREVGWGITSELVTVMIGQTWGQLDQLPESLLFMRSDAYQVFLAMTLVSAPGNTWGCLSLCLVAIYGGFLAVSYQDPDWVIQIILT